MKQINPKKVLKAVRRGVDNKFYTLRDLTHHNTHLRELADYLEVDATSRLEQAIIIAQDSLAKEWKLNDYFNN